MQKFILMYWANIREVIHISKWEWNFFQQRNVVSHPTLVAVFDSMKSCSGIWQANYNRGLKRYIRFHWWRHNMMTSSNGNIFRVTGPLSPVNSPHKGQWRGALMFSLIRAQINGWVNNSEAGDLRRNHAHYDVTVMTTGQYGLHRLTPVTQSNSLQM